MGGCEPIVDGVAGGLSPLPGVPTSIWTRAQNVRVEDFRGNTVSPSDQEGFATINPGGFVVTTQAPAAGDTVSRGLRRATLTPNPVALQAGDQRQALGCIAVNGFSAARPTFCAVRFAAQCAVATAADDYFIGYGFESQVAGLPETTDGTYLTYDRTLGVASWVLRCRRAGVATDQSLNLAWDNNFHTMGFLHLGTEVIPFLDGVVGTTLVTANAQPALGVEPTCHHLRQVALALAFNVVVDTDFFAWGS